jgi:hypothetical protein
MAIGNLDNRKLLFIALFTALVLVGSRINYSSLVGAPNQFFTLFQFFGPISGGFLGGAFGIAAVLGAQLIDFVLQGKAFAAVNLIRLLPMLFAAYYFSSYKSNKIFAIAVPVLATLLFWSHPVGAAAWYFPLLFWSIPVIVAILPTENLLLRALGATFTAHAIGGASWNYLVPMTPEAWAALVPIVMMERASFAIGIAISYVALNTVLDKLTLSSKFGFPKIDRRYVVG